MQGINTTLCYIERDGCYLMLHRVKKKNDLNHDKWIGIGGKFEDKESPEDCILREAKEETGLTHLFWADGFTGALRECDEGVLEWISKEKLRQIPKWEGDDIFLALLDQRVPFFSLKLCYQGDALTEAVLNQKRLPIRADLQDGQG